MTKLCVLMTCFNRKSHTLACLRALEVNVQSGGLALSAIVVDDGSTDGTSTAIRALFPWVHVIHGNGQLFWCRGMHKAMEFAMQSDFDRVLWLNDDTILTSDAVKRLLDCEQELRRRVAAPVIIVGSTVDDRTGMLTYGGSVRASAWKRMRFVHVSPGSEAQRCDAMNGNIVLLSRDVINLVGNLDPVFEHAMGDMDYALRASKLGVTVWVAPGIYGTCNRNAVEGTYFDRGLPWLQRWRHILGRKGLPMRSWFVFTRRHAGAFWPVYFCWPYFKMFFGKN